MALRRRLRLPCLAAFLAHCLGDEGPGRRRLADKRLKRRSGILHQSRTDGPFAVHEPAQGALVDAKTARGSRRTAENLDEVSEVLRKAVRGIRQDCATFFGPGKSRLRRA